MAAIESSVAQQAVSGPAAESLSVRLGKGALCLGIPALILIAPIPVEWNTKLGLAIAGFMIVCWMTEWMEYGAAGLVGLFMFWFLGVAAPEVIFHGFVDAAVWYYIGAVLLAAMATKTGLPLRIAKAVVERVGLTYSRLLLGLIIIDFLLTFIVPSGTARVVIMAPIAIGIINLFGLDKGSNIGRGIFLVITYSPTIFDKMILAGTGAITAQGVIQRVGEVDVFYSFWALAFLPVSIITIFAVWRVTLWLFPPEVSTLEGRREEVRAHFQSVPPWSPTATKACLLVGAALLLWLTDQIHHLPPAMIAFGIGLVAMLPFVDVLDAKEFQKANMLPFFFVGAALGMTEVLGETGGLRLLTDTFLTGLEPVLSDRVLAVPFLYWTGFVYHFFTASEISMLASSLPVLMEFSKANNLDPLWIGLVWSFSAGGKLFAYQSAVLVVGYSYGYFRHVDLIKVGAILTIIEFFALAGVVFFYWPLLGF
jgi:solute carrier family 13 (sodium-dependent dicarboxylate transporter), member 2/3/5